MNYQKIYNDFIQDRKAKEQALLDSGEYFERHHIKPRSLGGTNDASNMIALTAGDHYFAHLCLAMAYGGKMWVAVTAMVNMPGSSKKRDFITKRRWVNVARIKAAKVHAKNAKAQHKNGLTALTQTKEVNAKRSKTMKQYLADHPDHLQKMRDSTKTDQAKKNYSKAAKKLWQESPKANVWRKRARKMLVERNKNNNPAQTAEGRAKIIAYHNRPDVLLAKSKRISGDNNPAKRDEVRAKIAASCKNRDMSKTSGRNKQVINLDTKEVFYNVQQAKNSIKMPNAKISEACKGKRQTAGGYRWAYV